MINVLWGAPIQGETINTGLTTAKSNYQHLSLDEWFDYIGKQRKGCVHTHNRV